MFNIFNVTNSLLLEIYYFIHFSSTDSILCVPLCLSYVFQDCVHYFFEPIIRSLLFFCDSIIDNCLVILFLFRMPVTLNEIMIWFLFVLLHSHGTVSPCLFSTNLMLLMFLYFQLAKYNQPMHILTHSIHSLSILILFFQFFFVGSARYLKTQVK